MRNVENEAVKWVLNDEINEMNRQVKLLQNERKNKINK